jgi:hypothetical protein
MTFREAVIKAYVELGMSREQAELKATTSDAFLPDAAALTGSPVNPGQEKQFIEELKLIFRKLDAHPEAVQAALQKEISKRAKTN